MEQEKQEMTNEQKLRMLYELQQVDSKIDELRILQGELPIEVKDMGDEVEGLKTRLKNIENEIKELETQISDRRVQIENANAAISRYKEQQDNVRNNREYDNLTKEIEYQSLEIELCQKRIKEYTATLEARQADKAKTITDIEDRTVDLNQKKAELNDILSETKEQTEALMARSQEIEGQIEDQRVLTAFKRIRKNAHNGLAVVTVERDACGGCHNKIPAQRQLDIRLRKKIIVCEYCGRILINTDMANEVRSEETK
ncbi:MAG: hypothetical protein IJV55_04340 [Paludibacteraceae bacterium]|nr:hypothetical protein [Paludibacteraceae bacterium]